MTYGPAIGHYLLDVISLEMIFYDGNDCHVSILVGALSVDVWIIIGVNELLFSRDREWQVLVGGGGHVKLGVSLFAENIQAHYN